MICVSLPLLCSGLRQDFVTTSASHNRRSASFSFQRGESQPDEEDDDDDEDYAQLPPPQPRLSRAGPLRRGLTHSHTFSGIRDWTTLSYLPISPIQGQTGVRNTSGGNSMNTNHKYIWRYFNDIITDLTTRDPQSVSSSFILILYTCC